MKATGDSRQINALDHLALRFLEFYARVLSPRKGFRCALAAQNGGASCSGWARETVKTRGTWAAISGLHARFRECAQAAQSLRAARLLATPLAPRRSRRQNGAPNLDCSDACDCASELPCSSCESSHFDCCSCHPFS